MKLKQRACVNILSHCWLALCVYRLYYGLLLIVIAGFVNTNCCHGNNYQWALIEMSYKTEEDCHKTTIIITIEQTVESCKYKCVPVLSVPVVYALLIADKLPEFHETVRDNKRKRVYDAPKPSCYFHMEYQVLPGQPVYKTDVVTFGVVSKIYTDVDSRVVKTFQEGANISYGWKHT